MEEKLSKTLVNYSLKVKENDRVIIEYASDQSKNLVKLLIQEIVKNKGIPFVQRMDNDVMALLLESSSKARIEEIGKRSIPDVEKYDCFIHIKYNTNDYEQSKVTKDIRNEIGKVKKESNDIHTNQKRWVLLNYPSLLDAYKAKMTYDDFYKYAMAAMTVDYLQMEENIKPLKELMEKTDRVRVTGKNTDITFSIKDIPVIPCLGEMNIPDGEIFTAPVKDSVNGTITYNTPSPYQGNIYSDVSLTFENGKIVHSECKDNNDKLIEIFNTDEGSHYIGEFSLGLNPHITNPMEDILFDEKIIGSIHFTPGSAYKEAYNGNDSSVHWDMVLIQREEYGGGDIYFDDVLVRKNGLFVLPELESLNYHLK